MKELRIRQRGMGGGKVCMKGRPENEGMKNGSGDKEGRAKNNNLCRIFRHFYQKNNMI